MSDLWDKAIAAASQPASDTWRNVSNSVLRRRGAATYDTPLIPGYDELEADEVLLLPSKSDYEAQVAAGEAPGYRQENDALQRRGDVNRVRGLISQISKLAYDTQESPDGSWEPYLAADTNTFERDYSAERDRHIQQGIDIAWSGNESADRTSKTDEPSILNQSLRGGPQ